MLGKIMFLGIWGFIRLMVLIRWWRFRVEGLENLPERPQGYVLVSNHIHWIDIALLGGSLPSSHRTWWIAKIDLFSNALISWWFRQMQVIPIRRGRGDVQALQAAEFVLRSGGPLVIFPEGHRSRSGRLQKGRGGAVRLAVQSDCPIVPAAIWGTEYGFLGMLARRELHIRFGKPYYPRAEPGQIAIDRMRELTDELMLEIADMLPEPYRGVYSERTLTAEIGTEPREPGAS